MNRHAVLVSIAAAVILGGLYYIHVQQSAEAPNNLNPTAQPQLNASDAGAYGALYAAGAGQWMPSSILTITDPDPADIAGSYQINF
jgi:hypothetical protein